jgi:hypothetical protein
MALGCLAAAVVNTACLAVAVLLCLCIIGYNGLLKSTVLGPVAMGACRFLNVTLAIAGVWGGLEVSSNLPAALWLIPLGNGVYITGVTWFARQEATTSSRGSLSAAAFTLSGGLAIHAYTIAMFGRFDVAWIAAVLFTGVVVYRIATAIRDPSPQRVQSAIKTFVLGLAALDAVLATAFVGPLYGLAILFLLLPAFVLGRWIYST